MRELFNCFILPKCTWSERLRIYYLVISIAIVGCTDGCLLVHVATVTNLLIAVLLIRSVKREHLQGIFTDEDGNDVFADERKD